MGIIFIFGHEIVSLGIFVESEMKLLKFGSDLFFVEPNKEIIHVSGVLKHVKHENP